MPHSLRAKLSGLRYKGILEDKDYKRLCKALDNEDVLKQIRNEIAELKSNKFFTEEVRNGLGMALDVIDRCRGDNK